MSQVHQVNVTDLLLDGQNPRRDFTSTGQAAILRTLAADDTRKLLALARDLTSYGPSPTDLPLVMPTEAGAVTRVVLEGNRRLAAIRGLEAPDSLAGVLKDAELAQLRELAAEYAKKPIQRLLCAHVASREEARHWLILRHTGENQGAGLVRWAGDAIRRFADREARGPLDTQALNLLQDLGLLTAEQRRAVPTTSLRRLLSTPEVRDRCGVTVQKGTLETTARIEDAGRALAWVAKHLADKKTNVREIYSAQQRRDFAALIPDDVAVPVAVPSRKRPAEPKRPGSPKPERPPKRAKRSTKRDWLIPAECDLRTQISRITEIVDELKTLSLKDYANAVSVLFRVLVELSVDQYMKDAPLPTHDREPLASKMEKVLDDLMTKTRLSTAEAKPVRRAFQQDSFLSPSVNLMHAYVHSQHVFPIGSDLRASWEGLQPYMVAVCAGP